MKKNRQRNVSSAASVLSELVDSLGLRAGLSRHNVVRLWSKIVDPVVLRHVRAERVEGATLHLVADSSVWMSEMAAITPVLLEKVNAFLDPSDAPLTEIRFRQQSRAKGPAESRRAAEPELTEQDRRIIRTILEPVEDDALKKVLARILEKDQQLRTRRGKPTSDDS
jgi:hypothetical protein